MPRLGGLAVLILGGAVLGRGGGAFGPYVNLGEPLGERDRPGAGAGRRDLPSGRHSRRTGALEGPRASRRRADGGPAGVVLGPEIHFFGAPLHIGLLAAPLSVLWIVGVTNAFNLVDGLDGLSAGLARSRR